MGRAKRQSGQKSKEAITSGTVWLLCIPHNSTDLLGFTPDEKDALIKTLQRYYYKSPQSLKNIATKIESISASTLWRIIMEKEKNPHPKTLHHIFHFLEKERWIKSYESERKFGSVINYGVKKVKGWLGINSYKFKG